MLQFVPIASFSQWAPRRVWLSFLYFSLPGTSKKWQNHPGVFSRLNSPNSVSPHRSDAAILGHLCGLSPDLLPKLSGEPRSELRTCRVSPVLSGRKGSALSAYWQYSLCSLGCCCLPWPQEHTAGFLSSRILGAPLPSCLPSSR